MKRTKQFLLLFSFVCLVSAACRKADLFKTENNPKQTVEQKFLTGHRSANAIETRLVEFIERANQKKPFIHTTIERIGYPIWDKMMQVIPPAKSATITLNGISGKNSSSSSIDVIQIYYVPFVRDSQNYVNASMVIKVSPTDTTFSYMCDWQYTTLNNAINNPDDKAEKLAVFFMKFDQIVFGHERFSVKDKSLFRFQDRDARFVQIVESSGQGIQSNYMVPACQTIRVYYRACPYAVGHCGGDNGACDDCWECTAVNIYTSCFNDYNYEDYGGEYGGDYGSGGSGGGGAPPPNPCGPSEPGGGGGGGVPQSVAPKSKSNPSVKVNNYQCEPGWEPDDPVDSEGYRESRKQNLKQLLLLDGDVLIDCDSANVMPLDNITGNGKLFQRLGAFKVPQSVVDRLSWVAQNAPTALFAFPMVQDIDQAAGPRVNCDYYSVTINSLPQGMTAENILELFRKNTNNFIDPSINVAFSAYTDGNFTDNAKYYSSFEQAIGALVHIDMLNDGTVVLSDYKRTATHTSFIYSTIMSPLDHMHPVSGNREFGITQNANGTYTFYISGVDRSSDLLFAIVNSASTSFQVADNLWKNVRDKMTKFINDNGGSASRGETRRAQPKWDEVKKYLKGLISFAQLKASMGC